MFYPFLYVSYSFNVDFSLTRYPCFQQIETQKLDWNVESKCGSLDNAGHKAGGGDKKVCRSLTHPF